PRRADRPARHRDRGTGGGVRGRPGRAGHADRVERAGHRRRVRDRGSRPGAGPGAPRAATVVAAFRHRGRHPAAPAVGPPDRPSLPRRARRGGTAVTAAGTGYARGIRQRTVVPRGRRRVTWHSPWWRSARRRMLCRPLARGTSPMPTPSSWTVRTSCSGWTLSSTVAFLARAWRATFASDSRRTATTS